MTNIDDIDSTTLEQILDEPLSWRERHALKFWVFNADNPDIPGFTYADRIWIREFVRRMLAQVDPFGCRTCASLHSGYTITVNAKPQAVCRMCLYRLTELLCGRTG